MSPSGLLFNSVVCKVCGDDLDRRARYGVCNNCIFAYSMTVDLNVKPSKAELCHVSRRLAERQKSPKFKKAIKQFIADTTGKKVKA